MSECLGWIRQDFHFFLFYFRLAAMVLTTVLLSTKNCGTVTVLFRWQFKPEVHMFWELKRTVHLSTHNIHFGGEIRLFFLYHTLIWRPG